MFGATIAKVQKLAPHFNQYRGSSGEKEFGSVKGLDQRTSLQESQFFLFWFTRKGEELEEQHV